MKLTWLCLTVLNQVRFWRLWPACTCSQKDLTVFDCAEPGEVLKTVTSLYLFTKGLDCVWLCWTRWGSEDCDQPVHVHKLTWLCLTVLNQVRFWRLWPACTCSQKRHPCHSLTRFCSARRTQRLKRYRACLCIAVISVCWSKETKHLWILKNLFVCFSCGHGFSYIHLIVFFVFGRILCCCWC